MINRIIKFFLVGIVGVIFILALTVFYQYRQLQYSRLFSRAESTVEAGVKDLEFEVLERKFKREGFFPPHQVVEVEIKIPLEYSLDGLIEKIKQKFTSSRVKILNLEEINLKDTYQIQTDLGFEKVLTHRLYFSLEKAKIALLIDDFGYVNDETLLNTFFREMDLPFTISIIPGTPFAREIAREAKSAGKQILVHLPMQPEGRFENRYKWIILEEMSRERVGEIVREAIEAIPYAEGLNNHMGSLVTAKENIMQPVLEVLKEKKMFFVDSKTSPRSIAYPLAQKLGVRSTFRSVFLDNEKKQTYIERQFKRLLLAAVKKGRALGLGHADFKTASVLAKLIKKCDNRKFNFVLVSEILD
jgi:polysaccharide deacetylase 2 family uncharacterized protein YibQ